MRAMRVGAVVTGLALMAVIGLSGGAAEASGGSRARLVEVQDRCDPVTFNALLGQGSCVPTPNGDTTIDEFFEELNPQDFGDGHWRFSREDVSLSRGERIALKNTGGEAHSFTEVAAFGGGCVEDLNGPLGLHTLESEVCGLAFGGLLSAEEGGLLFPGQKVTVPTLSRGTHKFMCIIHPWMRSTVTQS